MKTVLICSRCGCGMLPTPDNYQCSPGTTHIGPVWQWPMANKFGPACGGIIEARIIMEEKRNAEGERTLL